MKLSTTEENYLKALYTLSLEGETVVGTNALAERLQTRASTVTDMLRKLGRKNLIEHTPYRGSCITETGRRQAIRIVRKHRLWETFLVDKLQFKWDEVHEIAEQLEHIQSTLLTERLAQYLGNPQYDPHGDPIPDAQGNYPTSRSVPLQEVKTLQAVEVVAVNDSHSDFLQYLASQSIQLGDRLEILRIENFDQSYTLRHGERDIQLSATAARQLYVRTL